MATDSAATMGSSPAEISPKGIVMLTRLQARMRGNRVRRAHRAADIELLYKQETQGARKFLAEKMKKLTSGIHPYVTVQHALYIPEVDKTRGVEHKAFKSRQNVGRTHSCYVEESTHTAHFTHMRGRHLDIPPHNVFTFLIPQELHEDELDEVCLQIMSEEKLDADSFVGVSILDLKYVRRTAVAWLAQGDHPHQQYTHNFSLWVKHSGRRQGSIDFTMKLRHVQNADGLTPAPKAEHAHEVVSHHRPQVWGNRSVLACTITILSSSGLRDPNAISQPVFEITHAPYYENIIHAFIVIVLYIGTGKQSSHCHTALLHAADVSPRSCGHVGLSRTPRTGEPFAVCVL